MNSIETRVLRQIGESVTSPDVFTDSPAGIAQIRQSVNDAIQELCMVTGSYLRTYHLALLADRQFYRLNPSADHTAYVVECWDTINKRSLTKTGVQTLAQADPWWMKRTGYPTQFMVLGFDTFGVYMIPSATGNILELRCACIPKPYAADTDPIKIRAIFERAAVHYAASEFYASRGDAPRATEQFQQYLEVAGLMSLNPQYAERQYQQGQPQPWNGQNGGPYAYPR